MEKIYVLILANQMKTDGTVATDEWDVFGLYSTEEKAVEALHWCQREDGLYQGCRDDLVYLNAQILIRMMDYNLP